MRNKGLDFTRKRKKKVHKTVIKEIFSWLFWLFSSAFIAIVLMIVLGLRTNVIGNSMEPNLYAGQQILINRLIYNISSPTYGDVIAFQPNGNENSHYYIKRVVALPGDSLQVVNGYLYLNDKPIESKESYDKIADPGILENKIYLSANEFFVLGDNINFSEDSRSGNIGVVNKSYIIGKVWFKLSKQLVNLGLVK